MINNHYPLQVVPIVIQLHYDVKCSTSGASLLSNELYILIILDDLIHTYHLKLYCLL